MFDLAEIIDIPPFSLDRQKKGELFTRALSDLTQYHQQNCHEYNQILQLLGGSKNSFSSIEDIPFIPVRLFKEYELLSVDQAEVIKTMTSSGTTGQSVSKIFLDKYTSTNQTKVLTKLVSSFTGKKRLPMLVIDTKAVLKDRNLFSARGAGILGFSMLGYDVTYALDERMELDWEQINAFIQKHKNEQILLFGFTFMIWEHFYKPLQSKGLQLPFENSILIHGGGWKKLIDEAVDNETYKKRIFEVTGIERIFNYYGMVEQTGSIFMECESGYLHSSIFSDVIIRDYKDFRSLGFGEQGLIQLVSLLPQSYPGHSILTEDIGELLGEDNCSCGRLGKYFKVHGRIKNAEIRGCSDTYAEGKK
ncbi:acyl-protein synthetase [Brevibacillus borstelensis]|uniref:LuxE/PaaK family acyltransferase n=1 Tax=Brevibacillus borstelensis TaxID=45462 RepID=UPI002E2170B5|nr:acyl-protein synthetase [Brevibacillus borstelensis]